MLHFDTITAVPPGVLLVIEYVSFPVLARNPGYFMSSFHLYISFHLTLWVACVPLESPSAYNIMYLFNLWIANHVLIKTFKNEKRVFPPLYHCTLWASKRSLKIGKCVGLLYVLGKLYKCQDQHLSCLYSRLTLVWHKDVLMIHQSDSDSDPGSQNLKFASDCPPYHWYERDPRHSPGSPHSSGSALL